MQQSDILRVLAALSAATMAQIDDCLKSRSISCESTPTAGSVQVTLSTDLSTEIGFLAHPIRLSENQPRRARSRMAILTEGDRQSQFATRPRSAASSQTVCNRGMVR